MDEGDLPLHPFSGVSADAWSVQRSPRRGGTQHYPLRSHPATCVTYVQDSEARRVRLLFDLSWHELG